MATTPLDNDLGINPVTQALGVAPGSMIVTIAAQTAKLVARGLDSDNVQVLGDFFICVGSNLMLIGDRRMQIENILKAKAEKEKMDNK